MKSKPRDIKGLLRNFKHYKVSADFNAQILKALDNMRVEKKVMDYKPSFFNLLQGYLSSFNRYIAVPVAMILIFVGVGIYYTQTSYAYHLNKAKSALIELESEIKGSPYQAYIIPRAMAANGVNEDAIVILTNAVVSSTERAIEIAERIKNINKLQLAFIEINKVQEKEVEVLSDATEIVETEKTAGVVAMALSNTVEQKESVDKAVEMTKKAIKEKTQKIKVNIKTTADKQKEEIQSKEEQVKKGVEKIKEERLEQNKVRLENAKKAVDQLKDIADKDVVSKFNTQLIKINEAIKDGRVNRVQGLTTAIQVKSKNVLRQEQLKKDLIEKKEEDATKKAEEIKKDKLEDTTQKRQEELQRIQQKKTLEQKTQQSGSTDTQTQIIKEPDKSTGTQPTRSGDTTTVYPIENNTGQKSITTNTDADRKVILDQNTDDDSKADISDTTIMPSRQIEDSNITSRTSTGTQEVSPTIKNESPTNQ